MKEELKELARKNWRNSFIVSHSDFFNHENEQLFLSSDQLYLYSVLCSLVRLNGSIVTSLGLIEECLPAPYSVTNPSYNRRKVKEVLVSLNKRNIVEINVDDPKRLRANDPIVIYINDEYIQENRNSKSFEKVSFDLLYESKSPMDFYLKCSVIRFDENPLNNKKKKEYTEGMSCSYEEWGNILNRTERNAIKIINDAAERRVLYINVGDYINENSQNINTYRIRPFKESEKTMATKLREQEIKDLEQDRRHGFGKKRNE